MPHETREANTMRTRRNIPVLHYALDSRGKPMQVKPYPNALQGTSYRISDLYGDN